MKLWFLKLHRWLALAFALPLLVVIFTGLVLSFEPWLVTSAIKPGSITPASVQSLIDRYDPNGRASAISYRSYDNTLSIGSGRGGGTTVDAATGEPVAGPSTLATTLNTMRRLHENLMIGGGWLVIASTVVMLVLTLIGVLMGWPRLRNNLSGWHKGMGWFLLPLIVLSPLSALLMAGGITLSGGLGAPAAQGAPLKLAEAVQLVGQQHDLSALVWLRPMGGRMMARIVEDGEYRGYIVSRDGVTPTPRNLPRLVHEGNFAGAWSSLMNIITSLAMLGLLVTGPIIWWRRRQRLAMRPARAMPQGGLKAG